YSAAELEREYTPASRVESIQTYLDEYVRAGQTSRHKISHAKLQYGSHNDAWLWLAENAASQKLIVFVHGGFWRRLSADDGTFLTPGWHDLGFNIASINYSLCPNESLPTLISQTSQAIDFLLERFASKEITLIGHSAGAQLVAMKLCDSNSPKFGGAIMVSGVFDLAPIVSTSVNEAVKLTTETAQALSPINFVADAQDTPIAVIWGENETDEFKRQSKDFATAWTSVNKHSKARQKEFASRNHFDILYELTSQHVMDLPSA
ncbi:MAG: alpha/beta hydrolase, partial [Acidimicrobiaceae bacterium]